MSGMLLELSNEKIKKIIIWRCPWWIELKIYRFIMLHYPYVWGINWKKIRMTYFNWLLDALNLLICMSSGFILPYPCFLKDDMWVQEIYLGAEFYANFWIYQLWVWSIKLLSCCCWSLDANGFRKWIS